MPGKIHYTSEQMAHDLKDIARQAMLDNFRPDFVVGIARGGVVPATMMSHYYQVPLITLNLSLRDQKVKGDVDYAAIRSMLLDDKKLLLIDDICDSGDTLAMVDSELRTLLSGKTNSHMSNLRTAVLWNNVAQDAFEADYVGREISRAEDERWIIFPYEEWWKA